MMGWNIPTIPDRKFWFIKVRNTEFLGCCFPATTEELKNGGNSFSFVVPISFHVKNLPPVPKAALGGRKSLVFREAKVLRPRAQMGARRRSERTIGA